MRNSSGRQPFVIAIDAGGTHTRVGCFSPEGEQVALATGRGGSPAHSDDAPENMANTISSALDSAGLRAEDALALAAGMAGVSFSGPNQGSGNNAWARDFFAVPGLGCPQVVVNDAVIAHRGALGRRAGVIVVAGTGSMILAITECDEEIESGHFEHYAGGARHLVFDVIERLLTTRPFPSEDPLAAAVLRHWNAADVGELRRQLLDAAGSDRNDLERRYGALAPAVTALAETSTIADAAVRALSFKTAQGIRILTPLVADLATPVALAGALATDDAFSARLREDLSDDPSVQLSDPILDPLGGAAVIAYQCAEIDADERVIGRLRTQRAGNDLPTIE